MAHNFLRGDRDQPFLLPPDPRDWLPQEHLAWFILDVIDQLDLQPFYLAHRDDGHGHPAYDPKTLLGVLLYGYCIGVRSSRQLERRCHQDLAFRILAANHTHDKLQTEVAEILRQAAETNQHEDRLFGDARGDELPKALASKASPLPQRHPQAAVRRSDHHPT
jgi:transposase